MWEIQLHTKWAIFLRNRYIFPYQINISMFVGIWFWEVQNKEASKNQNAR